MDESGLSPAITTLLLLLFFREAHLDMVPSRARMNMENKNRETQTDARPTTKRLQKEEEHNTDMCTWVRERVTRL